MERDIIESVGAVNGIFRFEKGTAQLKGGGGVVGEAGRRCGRKRSGISQEMAESVIMSFEWGS